MSRYTQILSRFGKYYHTLHKNTFKMKANYWSLQVLKPPNHDIIMNNYQDKRKQKLHKLPALEFRS